MKSFSNTVFIYKEATGVIQAIVAMKQIGFSHFNFEVVYDKHHDKLKEVVNYC